VAAMTRTSTRASWLEPTGSTSPVLKGAQQLRLEGKLHIADLVQEQRALVRDLEFARTWLAGGTGEGPGRHPKELGLQEVFRHGRDIDRDEGLIHPARSGVDGVGCHSLPVPVSPSSRTGERTPAARRSMRPKSRMAPLAPRICSLV